MEIKSSCAADIDHAGRMEYLIYTWKRSQEDCKDYVKEMHADGRIYLIFLFKDDSSIRFPVNLKEDGSFSPSLDEDMEILA